MLEGLWLLAFALPPDEMAAHWKMSKEFTLAVADAMPAEFYDFRPNPEVMSFVGLMFHIASSQAFRFAQVAGVPSPLKLPEKLEKAEVKAAARKALETSFDFCIEWVGKFTPEQLSRAHRVDWYERPEVNGRELLLGMFTHTAHHRGQAEVYLRVKGIKPPPYRF